MVRKAKKGKVAKKKSASSKAPAVKVRKSGIHGRGLFAETSFKKGDYLGTYEGRRTMRDGKYVLWVWEEDDSHYGIAGKNHMRFINHSQKPNAEFEGDRCIAIKRIKPGDEITFHYGEDWNEIS